MQGLDGSTLTAEKRYPINFTFSERTFYLILHYNGANNCLFVNGTDIFNFKEKRFLNCSNTITSRKLFRGLYCR